MTAPRAGETDRGVGASERSVRAPAAVPAFTILLLGGLALRLIIAYVLLPRSGFETDIASFTGWALRLAESGPRGFYDQAVFADYPPGYLYVLWGLGVLGKALAGLTGADAVAVVSGFVKLPPMLADVGVAAVLYALSKRWLIDMGRFAAPRIESLAVFVAALYLLNPVTIYDSAIWGQVDSVGALIMLGAVACLAAGFSEGAAGLAVMAGLVKPQFGIVLVPLVAMVLARRHLLRPGSGPRWSGGPSWLRSWVDAEHGIWRLVSSAAVGLVVLYLLLLPFGLDLPGFVNKMVSTAGGYPWLSVNAYNPWALVGSAGRGSLAAGGGWSPDSAFQEFSASDVAILGPLPGVVVGSVLLAIGFLVGLAQVAWRDDRRSLVLAAAFLSLAFFLLPTRVHERYLFPIFAFLPLLVLWDQRARLVIAILAAASFINLHAILTIPLYGTPNVDDLLLGPEFRTFPFVALSVLGHVAVFGYLLWQLDPVRELVGRFGSRRTLPLEARSAAAAASLAEPAAGSAALAAAVAAEPDAGTVPAATPAAIPAEAASQAAVVERPSWEEELPLGRRRAPSLAGLPEARAHVPQDPERVPDERAGAPEGQTFVPAVDDEEWEILPALSSLRARLRRRLQAKPVRADRTGQLVGEPPGRIERLDLLILVLVVLASLTLRTWRLEEPHGMHFDEVYHARTATEFLQHWRYGYPHDIYEFTHPHLAKYLIAAGIVALGGDHVAGTSSLGAGVRAALIEPRWSPPSHPGQRDGDRLWVATSAGLCAYDLPGIGGTICWPGTQAVALALDEPAHRLHLAGADGSVSILETTEADAARDAGVSDGPALAVQALATVPGAIERLAISQDGGTLYALLADDRIVSVDTDTGAQESEVSRLDATALVPLKPAERLVADPLRLGDVEAVVARLAEILDEPATTIRGKLEARTRVRIADHLTSEERSELDGAIAAGELPGVELESAGSLAVAGRTGVGILDGSTLEMIQEVVLPAAATGMVLTEKVDKPTLYVATGTAQIELVEIPDDAAARTKGAVRMPAAVRDVVWDASANLVHALGDPPGPGARDGIEQPAATLYVIQPHANAVFADAALSQEPLALVVDDQPERPSEDRQRIYALGADGRVEVVDAGRYSFAWRFPGVVAGALTAAFVFLLGRFLFRRRSVALLAAAFVLVDGMFFAQSRIAMNDSFVALFIAAAYAFFAPIYLGRWRGASALLIGLPLVAVLLGLALATKWVGAYAIGGVVLLILLRSALGRLIALAGMVLMTAVLGYLAITPAPVEAPRVNYLFLLLMLVLTGLLAAAIVLRPVRFTLQELRFAVVAPLVGALLMGAAGLLIGPRLQADGVLTTRLLLSGSVALVVLAGVAYGLARLAGGMGHGPLAEARGDPDDPALILDAPAPPPSGWLLPGYRWGLPWLFALACLAVIPIGVYVLHYLPWVDLGNQLVAGIPAGREGKQTLWELQISMYNYHNDLRATHAASSPWWAWPADLKPVWFYQEGLANNTTALIYDSGNLVLFWLTLVALPWAAWQAWRRRSLALTLVVLGFCCQWLPWARIDRATFQYHVFTSLPFGFLCLSYLLAELWHGPSRRTWQLARVAAAVAVVGAPLLWILRVPLCGVAGTLEVHPSSQACGVVLGQLVVSERLGATLLVLAVGLAALVWQLRPMAGSDRRMTGGPRTELLGGPLGWAMLTMALTAIAVFVIQVRFGERTLLALPIGSVGPYVAALLLLVPLAVASWHVLGARDPRHFVVVAVATAALWFALWYPNLAALPLPNGLANVYQGVLPTYNYDFQFAVNTDQAFKADLFEPVQLLAGVPALPAVPLLLAVCALTAAAVMYAAYAWRIELAVRRAEASLPDGALPGGPATD